ncbi:unnamed protein product, partial [Strongylus vulgaris]
MLPNINHQNAPSQPRDVHDYPATIRNSGQSPIINGHPANPSHGDQYPAQAFPNINHHNTPSQPRD